MRCALTLFAAVIGLVASGTPAEADLITYSAILTGPGESPPNTSPGTGFAIIDHDTLLHTMRVQVSFSGLLGTTTMSHIHAATAVPGVGTAPVATELPSFTGFPLGVTSGTYDHTFDLTLASNFNAAFVAANGGTAASAEAAFFDFMGQGRTYLNIHTTVVPGGEIRGFLSTPVPAPPAVVLAGIGLVTVVARRRRRAGNELAATPAA